MKTPLSFAHGLLSLTAAALACLVLAGAASQAHADEGMWLLTDPPRAVIKSRYGLEITDVWLDHVMRSSVKIGGGSGSFVSSDGLVMTNHHVAARAIARLSTRDRDLMAEGFLASRREDEMPCPGVELSVLQAVTDVTDRVNAAAPPSLPPTERRLARRAVMNTIEQESQAATGLRSDVVTLYEGARYHLYQSRRYTDVRLVFAPELGIAYFGGDPDNFEYPRHDLDVAFLRAYENGQPAKVKHWLRWSPSGPKLNEPVFVTGHPGNTDRQYTVRHLKHLRDRVLPETLDSLRRREVLLTTFSDRSLENARRAKDDLLGVRNGRKARLGALAGLQDPSLFRAKEAEEASLMKLAKSASPWEEISAALDVADSIHTDYDLLESGRAFGTDYFFHARTLLRWAEESAKPNDRRLREYRQSNLESLKLRLLAASPLYSDLETHKLGDGLSLLLEKRGESDPLVRAVLAGQSPRQRARQLISQTRMGDPAYRRQLLEGGAAALSQNTDPMIELAQRVDAEARRLARLQEEQVEEPLNLAYSKIAEVLFEQGGTSRYPDATGTLRLSFGPVMGYLEDSREIPAWTTLGDAYKHAEAHGHHPPFRLPDSWMQRREKLDLSIPFNFVCTADIIGGNSGSPVINAAGEVVGLIFDGNIHSLAAAYAYSSEQSRAVSVHSSAIREALLKIYDAGALAEELGR